MIHRTCPNRAGRGQLQSEHTSPDKRHPAFRGTLAAQGSLDDSVTSGRFSISGCAKRRAVHHLPELSSRHGPD